MNNEELLKRVARASVMVCILFAGSAWSEDGVQSKERVALRRVQQQMQQMKQEKVALEEKMAGLDKERTELQSAKDKTARQLSVALSKAKAESESVQQLQTALDAISQGKASVEAQKKELERRLEEQLGKNKESEQMLQVTRSEKKLLEEKLHANEVQLADSDSKNFALYKVGRDLIDQCRDKSATDVILRLEPFTGIKRVEIENQLELYRDRLDQERRSASGTGQSANLQ